MTSIVRFGASPTLTLPAGTTSPYMLYSARKLTGWGGNFCRVVRASDSSAQDIGFKANNTPDGASADTFATATTIRVDKLYDQSGNGFDLVQATGASRPEFDSRNEFRGIRPISICGEILTSKVRFMESEDTLALNRQAVTVYMLIAPRLSYNGQGFFDFTSLDFSTSRLKMGSIAGSNGLLLSVTGNSSVTATTPKSQPTLISWSMGASQIKRVGGVEATTATQFTSSTLESLFLGKYVGATQGASFDLLFLAVYDAAHSSATMQLMEAELTRCFFPVTGQTKRLVQNGSSLLQGYNIVANQFPNWVEKFGLPGEPDWEVYNVACTSTLTIEYDTHRASMTPFYDGTKSKNVYMSDAPSNDISAQTFANQSEAETYADTLYTTKALALVTYHSGTGFKVVLPTVIARSDHTTVNFREYARLRYNTNVRNGAAANGYTASDRAATLSNSGDTSLFQGDATHLTVTGIATLAAIDKAAILLAAA